MFIEEINKDERGEVFRIVLDNKVYWLSYTKTGFGRGGDIHNGKQFNTILSGRFKVMLHYPKNDAEYNIFEGDSIIIPKNIPHLLIAKKDSWMIEWHDHKLPPYKDKKFYKPYRKLCRS